MAREYDPSKRLPPVEMRVYYRNRMLLGSNVKVWHAECKQHQVSATGHTEAEAVRDFQSHLSRKHPGQTVKKVKR